MRGSLDQRMCDSRWVKNILFHKSKLCEKSRGGKKQVLQAIFSFVSDFVAFVFNLILLK